MSTKPKDTSLSLPRGGDEGGSSNNAAERKLIQTLVVTPARIDTADIETWRSAVNNFKRGNRIALYGLYENLLSDPVLGDAMDTRVEAITNAEITFQVNGENVEEIDDLIDTPEFEQLVKEIALQKAWGKSVIDTSFDPEFSVFSIPRKNIRIRNMERPRSEWKKFIAAKESDMDGYDYTQDEFMIECGEDDDMGYLWRAAQYVIYKRGNFGDWAQFAELFGMPFVTGRYNSYDTTTRDQLYEALGSIGGKPYAAIPKEADIEIHDNKSSGSNDLYSSLRRACNEEILIAIKGNTMTTLDGSSRSQAEVHEDQQSSKTKSDRRYVQRMLNKHFVPLLIKRGYPATGGFFLFPEQGEKMTVKDQVDLALKLRNANIPVADNYFYEITGIPAAEIDDTTPSPSPQSTNKTTDTPPSTGEDADTPSSPNKKQSKKKKLKLLDRFFAFPLSSEALRRGGKGERPERGFQRNFATRLTDSITGKLTLADKYAIDIDKLLQQAIDEIYGNATVETEHAPSKKQPAISRPLFDISNQALQQGINSVFSDPDFGSKNEEFINEFRHNTAVFAAFKNHNQTNDIVALLHDEEGNLRSFRDFEKLALKVSKDYNVNWLQTEYNTAVRAARAAVNYRKALATKHIYPNLEYIESTAVVQREEHLEYVGTVLPIEHPWWDTHMPPSDWNCACSTRPSKKEVTDVPGGDHVDPVFQNNPGKTAEFVNMKEHPYIKGVCPYFNSCKRKNYGSQLKLDLADTENPPVIPQCEICKLAATYQKKTAAAKKREAIVKSMEVLLKKNVIRQVGGSKSIKIKFSKKGNSHLADDLLNVKLFPKKDAAKLGDLLRDAEFVRSRKLYKKRSDDIVLFYYFYDKKRNVYYNVAESVKKNKGIVHKQRFLYAITKSIPE